MAGTNFDWTMGRVHGTPVHELDGYSSLALAVDTTPEHHQLRRNTVYRLHAKGDDVHVLLLSEDDVADSVEVTTSNSMFVADGETAWITTKSDMRTFTRVDGNKDEKTILAVRANDGSGTLYVTIMDSRAGR